MELRQESALLAWLAPSSLTPGNARMPPIQSTPKPRSGYIRVTAVCRLAGISFLLARPRTKKRRMESRQYFFPQGEERGAGCHPGPCKAGWENVSFPMLLQQIITNFSIYFLQCCRLEVQHGLAQPRVTQSQSQGICWSRLLHGCAWGGSPPR